MTNDGLASSAGGSKSNMSSPTKIAEAADRIYGEKFKEGYERDHKGKYVVIDVSTEAAYLGDSSDDALANAREASPHGVFHLIRVGSRSAFKATRSVKHQDNWLWAL